MNTQVIRRGFLNYFKQKDHVIVPSSPVIPYEDPTLLFTNAGMNQFKDVFLGASQRDYQRAVTAQKCVRVGGKHNDLENVGHTSRHLTFFEMLGNFSFGDYFKKEAIQFAWEVTVEILQFEPERIWPSVFRDDDEAFELWKQYVPEHRITRLDEKDNFWAMGETGPCGPCSELYYDRGPRFGNAQTLREDTSGERYLEFWNLVFMQFNRNLEGQMVALPKPSIDTGAGIERMMSLKLNRDSVFETDILRELIASVETVTGITYHPEDALKAPAFRVIADHVRTLAFAIADGVQPSNVDRGYVLRKVLRRAVRYGRQLDLDQPFLAKLLPQLNQLMGVDYPELITNTQRITDILNQEEEAFFRTLKRGGNLLNQIMERAKQHKSLITGDDAFKLKDTYGLPYEEIELLAKDHDLKIEMERYQELEKEAKEKSRQGQKTVQQMASENIFEPFINKEGPTQFTGWTELAHSSMVKGIVKEGQFVTSLLPGEEGLVLLEKTPFYAEMGGQVGDIGSLSSPEILFRVIDCKSPFKGLIAHIGKMEKGILHVNDSLMASVDADRRQKIANNHTATHLLHWALHKVLGEHIKQAGSVVDAQRLRFDFSHHKALSNEEIQHIENLVNTKIRENHRVKAYELPYAEVKDRQEIKQFFGEKYGLKVRVVETDISFELCGGTHTSATGNIGYFRILKESSIAAGVRRIEAVTGELAEALAKDSDKQLETLASLLKCTPMKLREKIEKLVEENKVLTEKLKKMRLEEIQILRKNLLENREILRNVTCITGIVPLAIEELRHLGDALVEGIHSGIVLLGSANDNKANLYLRLSEDLIQKGLQAHVMIRDLATLIDGSGGGKAQAATAGGKAPDKLPLALLKVRDYIP